MLKLAIIYIFSNNEFIVTFSSDNIMVYDEIK